MQAVYLTPCSTFPGSFPSNTLFGAICRGLDELGYDVGAFINEYGKRPPLLISSCFPFTGSGKDTVRLYPMPDLPPFRQEKIGFDLLKSLKKIRWVEEKVFFSLCDGSLKLETLLQIWDRFAINKKYGVLATEKSKAGWIQEEVDIPHNQINRLSTASEKFYHITSNHFGRGGLWFLADFRDPGWKQAVMASLNLLADQGIGKKRSSGQGVFTLSTEDVPFPDIRNAQYLTSLARFLPSSFTPFGDQIWYDLISVRGRTNDGVMKKRVVMLAEGAVFKNTGEEFYGSIARVRESPPMVEYGCAFTVGLRGLS